MPVVGVVPYMHVDIDDEDSLADRLDKHTEKGLIDIAVIRVPQNVEFYGLQCTGTHAGRNTALCGKGAAARPSGSDSASGYQEYHGGSEVAAYERSGGFGFEIGSGTVRW